MSGCDTPSRRVALFSVTRLRFQIIAATLARLVVNTAHRMVYPFLPAFSRGLGVPLEALTLVLSVRGGLGMTSPFFGLIPDRLGRRHAMLVGLLVFCAGLALVGLFPSYPAFFTAAVLVVASKFIFDPALQAYLGDRTPYERRGLVIALTEIGWSGAALVGLPLVGLMIARGGWQSPFLPLAGLGLVSGLALWQMIPPDGPHPARAASPANPGEARVNHLAAVWLNPRILAAMSIGLLTSGANECLNAVYGAWMEQTFGLPVAALGFSTTVLGLAELAGEGLVMGLADRLGKRRSLAIGLAASIVAYLLLPFLSGRLALALAGLFFIYIAFEFAIVTSIPLMTELVPEARGVVMSGNVAFHSGGRMVGALVGGWVFRFGFLWIGAAAALLNLIALGVVIFFVRERK